MPYVVDGYVVSGYIGQPGSPVSFRLGSNTIPFGRSPLRPGRSLGFVQADVRSAGGERVGRDYYVKGDLIDLSWPSMSEWDKGRLLTFWRDTARGMSAPFTYTDIAGTSVTVRFATPKFPEIRPRAHDAYEVRVQLRVE